MIAFIILVSGVNYTRVLLDTPLVKVLPETQAGLAAGSTFRDSVYYMESTTSPNLYGFDVKLYFNPYVINCDRIVDTTALSNGGDVFWLAKEINNTNGWLWVACACMSPNPGLDGNGKLFSLVWRVVDATGWSILRLKYVDLSDPDAYPILYNSSHGWYKPPGIAIILPDSGEWYTMGTSKTIKWVSKNVSGGVKLELYKSGSLVESIVEYTPNDGLYLWDVPITYTPDTTYKVKITAISEPSINDYSDGNFTLCRRNKVLSPNGGEWWIVGETHAITWTPSGISGDCDIWYYNGSAWKLVSYNAPDASGSYSWTVPNTPTTQAKVKIYHIGHVEETVDSSDATFTIATGPPGVEEISNLKTQNLKLEIYPNPFTR
ncbi:MAG: hypothetical protein QMD71_10060, partial [bacterium]|nr:hypothetical protein [bacterium]